LYSICDSSIFTLSFSPDFIFLSSAVTSSPKRSSSSKDFLVGKFSTSFANTDASDKHDCPKSSPAFLLCLSSQTWHFVVLSDSSFGSDTVEVVELASTVATGDDPVVGMGDDTVVATVVAAVVVTDEPTFGNISVVTGGTTSVVTSGNNSTLHTTSSGELAISADVNEQTDWIKGLIGLKDLKSEWHSAMYI